MHLTLVTPPATEPVTVAQFAADRRMAVPTGADLTHAEQVIAAARGHVEQYTRRALIRQRLRVEVSGRWVATPVRLLRPPVIELASVSVDGTPVALPDVELLSGTVWPLSNGTNAYHTQWLTASGYARRVAVEYWAGYGATAADVPAALRQAVLRIAGTIYEQREDAVVGHSVAELPLNARTLMDPFRLVLS